LASLGHQRQGREEPGFSGIDELSRKYHAILIRYFRRRGFQQSDAQDLAQEVFCRLSRQSLDRVESIESYLFVTAGNVARDLARRNKIRADHPAAAFVEEIQLSGDFSPERQLGSRQELECVLSALNEMPERMRTIFILARLEDVPRGEIASRLGVSKSTVEQTITKATACLADRRRRAT
jgi:RNA polymerase sigma-70 factor (ECF subfamily)